MDRVVKFVDEEINGVIRTRNIWEVNMLRNRQKIFSTKKYSGAFPCDRNMKHLIFGYPAACCFYVTFSLTHYRGTINSFFLIGNGRFYLRVCCCVGKNGWMPVVVVVVMHGLAHPTWYGCMRYTDSESNRQKKPTHNETTKQKQMVTKYKRPLLYL